MALDDKVVSLADLKESHDYLKNSVDDINADLEKVALVDGSYSSMTVGNAEQLLGTVGEEDSTPYNFRTSGGSIDIGDREEDMVVGGTVVWNQIIRDGNFTNEALWAVIAPNTCSFSFANNIATVTVEDNTQNGRPSLSLKNGAYPPKPILGHKYLAEVDSKKTSSARTVTLSVLYGAVTAIGKLSDSWTHLATVFECSTDTTYLEGTLYISEQPTAFSVGDTIEYKNYKLHDLTQMFGSTIADYIYNLEQANEGDGVAWFEKLFPKDYYEYDEGTLMSVKTSAHKMVGFNIFDGILEEGGIGTDTGAPQLSTTSRRSKNFIKCLPNTAYYFESENIASYIWFYDYNKNFISFSTNVRKKVFTTPQNCYYMKFRVGDASNPPPQTSDGICINLSWDGERDGEYEPYEEHVYPLDSSLELRGIPKLDSANNLYYDGDTYESDGTVTRRFGVVDLGSLAWAYRTGHSSLGDYFYSDITNLGVKFVGDFVMTKYNSLCQKLLCVKRYLTDFVDGTYCFDGNASGSQVTQIQVKDFSYTDATAFKSAMSGVYLVYELATPTTETAEPYQNPQIVDDFGTEEYVDERDVAIPVGHQTKYLANLRAKLEMSPDSPSADGEYIVKQTNGKNEYIALGSSTTMQSIMAKLPSPPSEDGTYTLKVTVANGTATYSWGE